MVVGGVAIESVAPVRRLVLTMDQFKTVIQQKYGSFNNDVLANTPSGSACYPQTLVSL
jgi:hypothetical protein